MADNSLDYIQSALASWKNRKANNIPQQNYFSPDTSMPDNKPFAMPNDNNAPSMPNMGENNTISALKPKPDFLESLNKGLQNPISQALIGMGTNIMATPPRNVPYSDMEVLGRGGKAGLDAFNQANESLLNRDLSTMKMNTEVNNLQLMNSPLPPDLQAKTGLKTYGEASKMGSFAKLLSGGEGESNKTDFTTFKAGRPRKEGESPSDWNKRVSDEWEKRQDDRAKSKQEFTQNLAESKGYKTWSPAEKHESFETWRFTGKSPNFSNRDASGKNQWEKDKNKYIADNGGARKFAADQAKFKSDTASYQNVKKASDMTDVAIQQTDHNASALKVASDAYQRSNYPAPNKVINWSSEQFGSPEKQAEFAKFKLALMAFSREYMRVVTGAARSVAELSVGAQASADDILSKFSSWQTLQAQVDQAKIEIENVHKSYQGTLRQQSTDLYGKDPIQDKGSANGGFDMDAIDAELKRRQGK
jgi:hypothetical protein